MTPDNADNVNLALGGVRPPYQGTHFVGLRTVFGLIYALIAMAWLTISFFVWDKYDDIRRWLKQEA